jgi:hypothetical protein
LPLPAEITLPRSWLCAQGDDRRGRVTTSGVLKRDRVARLLGEAQLLQLGQFPPPPTAARGAIFSLAALQS